MKQVLGFVALGLVCWLVAYAMSWSFLAAWSAGQRDAANLEILEDLRPLDPER